MSSIYSATLLLPYIEPFDFAKSLAFLRSFPPARTEQLVTVNSLTKAVREAKQTVAFRLRIEGEGGNLQAELFSDYPLTSEVLAAITDRLSFYLSLRDDLTPFYALAQKDEAFQPVLEKLYGYHQVKFITPFENACWAILCQRIPMAVAQKMKQALTECFANQLMVDGTLFQAFPNAQQLANCTLTELKDLLGNNRKAEYLNNVILAFSEVDEQFLRNAPYAQVRAWLLSIKGIGEWTASFVLIRGLGRLEEIPSDRALQASVAKIYGEMMTPAKFHILAGHYQEWQGYWGHYLRVYT